MWHFAFQHALSVRRVVLLTLAILFSSSFFLISTSIAHLKAFLVFDWPDSCGTEKIWMSSFQIIWHFENRMVRSKVMGLRSELIYLVWFLRYLNCFNSNFYPLSSHLKGNSIFFAMTLVLPWLDSWIKSWFSIVTRSQFLVKFEKNLW